MTLPRQPRIADTAALRRAWRAEHAAARLARTLHDPSTEWHHLERAHVLSQPMAGRHVVTHVAMLGFAVRRRDRREFAGQVLRTLLAAPGSLTRRYPLGNTGGANVPATQPMRIAADIRPLVVAS